MRRQRLLADNLLCWWWPKIFSLSPTRADTIQLWHAAGARQSFRPLACRAGSSVRGTACKVSELKQIVLARRDEIARLKVLKGRLSIKPSGMEDDGPKCGGKLVKHRRRGKVTPRVVSEIAVLRVAHPMASSTAPVS